MSSEAILLIPGLGNHQWQMMPFRWMFRQPSFIYSMEWGNEVDYTLKLEQALAYVDELHKVFQTISIIAVSAGVPAALNILYGRPKLISAVVGVCGMIEGDEKLNPLLVQYRDKNPDFYQAVRRLTAIQKAIGNEVSNKVLTFGSTKDPVVPSSVAKFDHAPHIEISVAGHVQSIATVMVSENWRIKRFLAERRTS